MRRRDFLAMTAASGLWLALPSRLSAQSATQSATTIDRKKVVARHNPVIRRADPFSALTVGNGSFAFTSDVTGLQTFTADYRADFPLCTASHWGWHTTPLPPGMKIEDYRFKNYDTHGRPVGYATSGTGQEQLFNWLRENPHRMHLGRLSFNLKKPGGSPLATADLSNIRQELDLFSGLLTSRFDLLGRPVRVQSACHPEMDLLAVTIDSPLLQSGQLTVQLAFPYPSPQLDMADWNSPARHHTQFESQSNAAQFHRIADDDRYNVRLAWTSATIQRDAEHRFTLAAAGPHLEFTSLFSPQPVPGDLPTADQTRTASADHWQTFWSTGGCIDLGNCTDSRAPELERRIVLSQYNTALHCCGPMPPAETGLLSNSWYGKAHLEMHWWHAVHFAAWNRFPLLDRSLDYYHRIMHVGLATAKRQGYAGCRWPKMVGPDGRDSPSPIAPLLIWQQPHPIYYAELSYRQSPTDQTLRHWQDIVFQSADFMAGYAFLDPATGKYTLGPPLKTVSENTDTLTTTNPTFELAYWRFGLRTAQEWRNRLGLSPDLAWQKVLDNLAPLPQNDGRYLFEDGCIDTYTNWNWEHPAILGACGMQPGDGTDPATMNSTVKKVFQTWQWDRAWGWDFPMAALAAARAGEPDLAVKALLINSPKNLYHPNGHNYQRPNLTAYLPGNGGLLSATAMMCAGWTNGPTRTTPGYPADGKWDVRFEDLHMWM